MSPISGPQDIRPCENCGGDLQEGSKHLPAECHNTLKDTIDSQADLIIAQGSELRANAEVIAALKRQLQKYMRETPSTPAGRG